MAHFEKKIDGEVVFQGNIIQVRHDRVELENGRIASREVVVHPGAVVMLAVQDGFAYLVRQYRYCVGRELLEVPAGKLEAGEDHREAALRELKEETGAVGGRVEYLGEIFSTPGLYTEVFYMYFATDLQFGAQSPDEDEFLSVERLSLEEYGRMIERGEIHDAKTICIYAMAKARGLI